MLHSDRVWCVVEVALPETLAEKLSKHTWCCCMAFRIGDYFWLNDSTSPDRAQEYAVLKRIGDNFFIQIESITFSWCDPDRSLEFIQRTLDGEFDTTDWCRPVKPSLEVPEHHGRCQHCA